MKSFLLRFLLLTAVAILLWWPVADRYVQGPRMVTHGVFPAAFALIAVLAWRLLRSLLGAMVCAAAIALVVFLMYRYFGDTVRPFVERLWR